MAKKLKKNLRIRGNLNARTIPISSRRVIVFRPSTVLKQRINGSKPCDIA
jgi:hypothetical protein